MRRNPRGRRNPPIRVINEGETFTWGPHRWYVAKGWQLVADRGGVSEEPDGGLRPEQWINMLGGVMRIDKERAMTDPKVDVTQPVLVATMLVDGEETSMIIDGWHRMYKATQTGVERIGAFVLDVKESESIKVGNYYG